VPRNSKKKNGFSTSGEKSAANKASVKPVPKKKAPRSTPTGAEWQRSIRQGKKKGLRKTDPEAAHAHAQSIAKLGYFSVPELCSALGAACDAGDLPLITHLLGDLRRMTEGESLSYQARSVVNRAKGILKKTTK